MPQSQVNPEGALKGITGATQKFIADTLTKGPDKVYRLDDYDTIRTLLFDNTKRAVQERFPLVNDRYTLAVEDVDYDDPDYVDLSVQRQKILENGTDSRRLRGSWVLRDTATGNEVARTKRMTLMKVPRMTDRGTFIRNGKEYTLGSILRLEPGVYCRKTTDSMEARFNIKQGTGHGFTMEMQPSTGVFRLKGGKGGTGAPAYTVLKDMGVTDDQMKAAWGPQIFEANRKAGLSGLARSAADNLYGN